MAEQKGGRNVIPPPYLRRGYDSYFAGAGVSSFVSVVVVVVLPSS